MHFYFVKKLLDNLYGDFLLTFKFSANLTHLHTSFLLFIYFITFVLIYISKYGVS